MHNCLLSLITIKKIKNNRGQWKEQVLALFHSFIIPFNLLFQHFFSFYMFFNFLNQLYIPKKLKEKKWSDSEKYMDA